MCRTSSHAPSQRNLFQPLGMPNTAKLMTDLFRELREGMKLPGVTRDRASSLNDNVPGPWAWRKKLGVVERDEQKCRQEEQDREEEEEEEEEENRGGGGGGRGKEELHARATADVATSPVAEFGTDVKETWVSYWDAMSQRQYYHHPESGKTQWEYPSPSRAQVVEGAVAEEIEKCDYDSPPAAELPALRLREERGTRKKTASQLVETTEAPPALGPKNQSSRVKTARKWIWKPSDEAVSIVHRRQRTEVCQHDKEVGRASCERAAIKQTQRCKAKLVSFRLAVRTLRTLSSSTH